MNACRSGTSLSEVLLALVLITFAASWALQAAASTERAVGASRARAAAMQRATLALAELQSLPCDTMTATRTATEPRWLLHARRRSSGAQRIDDVALYSRRGDTINTSHHIWCSR